jgi:pimeloyl-ACP methyl ester carboxylesterase
MTEIYLEHEGVVLYAVERGAGIPLVLLHGGLANHLACWQFAGPLAERFRVITPDLRAAGRSVFAGPLDWDQLAGDVAALIRHLGAGRAVVGGVSFGAGVAVRVALRHPDVMRALVILAPAYGGAELGLSPAQAAAMAAIDAAGRRAPAEGVRVLVPLFDALPDEIRERARGVVAGYDAASVAATTRFMASGAQPFASGAELAAITVPTLLVPGADPTHPPEVAGVFRRHVPRCAVCQTEPPGYAGAIAEFLASEDP